MFKIVVPVKSFDFLRKISNLGIDDFYGGLNIEELSGRNVSIANFSSVGEFKKTIQYAEKNNLIFALTLNSRPIIHTNEELEYYFNIIKRTKIKYIIITDLLNAKKFNKNILHISSLSPIYNNNSIINWLHNGNISRIILPRELSVNEKINIINSFPKLEFEIFFKNDWCYISSDVCSGIHYKENLPRLCSKELTLESDDIELNQKIKNLQKTKISCKVCEIYSFKNIYLSRKNNLYLKIVGRQKREEEIFKDVIFGKKVINNVELSKKYSDFIKLNIIDYYKVFGKFCNYHNCEFYFKYIKKI